MSGDLPPEKKRGSINVQAPEGERSSHNDVPQFVNLRLSLEGMPAVLVSAIENLAKPKPTSRLKSFLKDYLPALTPVATALIAGMVSFYIYQSDHDRSKEALEKTLSEFGQNTEDRPRTVAAIKLATYGTKALGAVKMVLGAKDPYLRSGGVLVAEQMYRAQTVEHEELTRQLLSYFAANDSYLRRGVLEWLTEMEHQLSDKEATLAFDVIQQSFGPGGELCASQNEEVAAEAANFLFIWSFKNSTEFVLGLAQKCKDVEQPERFAAARLSAVNTFFKIARSLPAEKRADLLKGGVPKLREAVPELKDVIDQDLSRMPTQ
jgi:hypothetical protein